jgi:uncharacterized membrane protein/predicted DsbA family dithiol-disulfide isomerase
MQKERTAAAAVVGTAGSLVPVLVGLVASAMLLVDYLRPVPVFCAETGCQALRQTAVAAPLGIPLPVFGVTGFLALGVVALYPGLRMRLAQAVLGVGAGLVGVLLIMAQAHYGQICPFCLLADASGMACALAASARMWLAADAPPAPRPLVYGGAGSLALAVVIPIGLGLRASPIPDVIRDEIAQTPRGQATVVDFVDFECPFCRMTHAELEPLLEQHKGQIRVVRRQVPLRIHPHAMDAAKAACCGEKMGQGDAMANALFTAPVEELTPEGCEKIAKQLGLSLDAYRACVADPATGALIEADRAEFKAAGGYALPTLWIGAQQIVGAQPDQEHVLEHALSEAMTRAGS